MIDGQHCMVLNPKHPSWNAEDDELYRKNFFKKTRSDITQFCSRSVLGIGRHNGRDMKRLSLPDAMSFGVAETSEEEQVMYSFSKFWVGRVL